MKIAYQRFKVAVNKSEKLEVNTNMAQHNQ